MCEPDLLDEPSTIFPKGFYMEFTGGLVKVWMPRIVWSCGFVVVLDEVPAFY